MNKLFNEPEERKRPRALGWVKCGKPTPEHTTWTNGFLYALSSLVYIDDDHQPGHWGWIVSFSGKFGVPTDDQVKKALKDFAFEEAEEVNHEPGIARKFWLAVEQKYRKPCPCKDEEIIDCGVYKYSRKKEIDGMIVCEPRAEVNLLNTNQEWMHK